VFNVCPGCGEYSDDKQVITRDGGAFAVCEKCNYQHPFRMLPLLVITGASGTGKTTVALRLPSIVTDCVCMESDILWHDAFNKPEEDYKTYRNLWLRVAKNISQCNRPVALIGSSTPGQFEKCPESRYFSKICYLALVCEEAELVKRLKARPSWRDSGSEEVLKNMINFNQWLIENAAKSRPTMSLLDTSNLTVDETVTATKSWIERSLDAIPEPPVPSST
jgi:broad-specificity NMP kinase